MENRLLSLGMIAKRFRIPVRSLYRWARQSGFPHGRQARTVREMAPRRGISGNTVLYDPDQVWVWLAEHGKISELADDDPMQPLAS